MSAPETCAGYTLCGPRTVTRWGFVQRWAAHPSTWLRCTEKIGKPGEFWVSGFKTRKDALDL